MNATQADNLRILIRHMETKVTRTLDMGCFFDSCGTPACAAGEATVVPELREQGMDKHGAQSLSTLERVFGDVYARLFSGSMHRFPCGPKVTPQEWAVEARKVLAENGYAMDDGFKTFMDKVREPVSLEAVEAHR